MADINELDKRLAVAESEFKNLKEVVDEVKTHSRETFEMVSGLKERLDKQNGLLPHMAEKVELLSENFNSYVQQQQHRSIVKKSSDLAKPAKWAAMSAVATATIAAIVELIRTFVLN